MNTNPENTAGKSGKEFSRRDFLKFVGAAAAVTAAGGAGEILRNIPTKDESKEKIENKTVGVNEILADPELLRGSHDLYVEGYLKQVDEKYTDSFASGVTSDQRVTWFKLYSNENCTGPYIYVKDQNMTLFNGMLSDAPESELSKNRNARFRGTLFNNGQDIEKDAPENTERFIVFRQIIEAK